MVSKKIKRSFPIALSGKSNESLFSTCNKRFFELSIFLKIAQPGDTGKSKNNTQLISTQQNGNHNRNQPA